MNRPKQVVTLSSNKYRVMKILKKTVAKGFKNIEAGDLIQFSTVIERHRDYAIYVTMENLTKDNEKVKKTFNEITPLIANFELEVED